MLLSSQHNLKTTPMATIKSFLKAFGTYILFFILIFGLNWLVFSPTFAFEQIANLLSSAGEILIISLIASLFFKKSPNSLFPLVIGILGSSLLELHSLIANISYYNIQRELAELIENQPLSIFDHPSGYLMPTYYLTNDTLLGNIYEWIFSSEIPGILVNGIFFIGYKEATIKCLKWYKGFFHIALKYIPFMLLVLFQISLIEIFETTFDGAAALNIVGIYLVSIIYFSTRLRKNVLQKQFVKLKEDKYLYIIAPISVFLVLITISLFIIFPSFVFIDTFHILSITLLCISSYYLFKEAYKGTKISIVAVVLWFISFSLSIYESDVTIIGRVILGLIFSIPFILWMFNLLKLYKPNKKSPTQEQTLKEKTLREIFEEKVEVASKKRGTNWILIAIIITIFLGLIGGAFYWFEYRPTQIKKDCSWTEYETGKWREARESEYEKCIRRNGLLE